MRLRHSAPVARASFDDLNLVSCAGLEPVMRLAEACDLPGIVREKVHLPTSMGPTRPGRSPRSWPVYLGVSRSCCDVSHVDSEKCP